jgi:hypothetical protein
VTSSGINERLRILQESESVTVMCVGLEKGKTTGYEHLQGFIQYSSKKTAMQVKSNLTNETHVEAARDTTRKCVQYCQKEHKVQYEKNTQSYDDREKTEQKITFAEQHWRDLIKDCEKLEAEEIKEKYPKDWVLRRGAIERMITEASAKTAKTWDGKLQEKNFWIWGMPGVGKSRWAILQQPMQNILRKNNNKWWCCYHCSNTKLVILEDYPAFPQGDALAHHMKVWADRYPFLGEIKGGGVTIEPGRWALVVTSNYCIDECFGKEQDKRALHRRFNEIEMTAANKKLIDELRIDFAILTTKTKEREREQIDEEMTEEEVEDWENHLQEVQEMEDEARERAEQGLDEVEEEW